MMNRIRALCCLALLVSGATLALAAYASFEEAFEAGMARYSANKPAEARVEFTAALALTKEGGRISRAHLLLGHCYLGEKNPEKAIEEWRLAVKTPNGQPLFISEAQYNIGYRGFYERGKYKEAREELTKVLELKYLNVDYRVMTCQALGACYFAEKDYLHAREEYLRSLKFMDTLGYPWEINNLRYTSLIYLAACYTQEKNLEKAKETWQTMVEVSKRPLRPGSYFAHGLAAGQAYWELGKLLYDEKKYPDAREAFTGAIANWSYIALDARAQLYLGHCYMEEKDIAHAKDAYRKLLDEPKTFRQGVPADVKAEAEKRLKQIADAEVAK